MRSRVIDQLAREYNLTVNQVEKTISSRDDGVPLSYLVNYARDIVGDLDEKKVLDLEERYRTLTELEKKKATLLHTIHKHKKLTEALQKSIEQSYTRSELDDLSLAYRTKHKSRPVISREKFLLPLVDAILEQSISTGTLEELASPYIDSKKQLNSVPEVLAAAKSLLCERLYENSDLRKIVRNYCADRGQICSTRLATARKKKKISRFESFFNFNIPVSSLNAHKIFMLRRGVDEGILQVSLKVDQGPLLAQMREVIMAQNESIGLELLELALQETLEKQILPSIENDIMRGLREKAEKDIIDQVINQVERLVMAPPFGQHCVMGIDPGYKSGCKIAVVDNNGAPLATMICYPHEPQNEIEKTKTSILELVQTHGVEAIVIGDGIASRETDQLVKDMLREAKLNKIMSLVISEIGTSSYAASSIAGAELPELEFALRGAVSIARRFQDPLRELVKIDPRALASGPFIHYINQNQLRKYVRFTLEKCVNTVGTDLNTASRFQLSYVSGLSDTLSKRIIKHREEKGPFKRKTDLLSVNHFGKKAFQFSAGFLRVHDGEHPLDATAIHPDHYELIEHIAQHNNLTLSDMLNNPKFLKELDFERYADDKVSVLTLNTIQQLLLHKGRTLRSSFTSISLNESISSIADIKPAMVLTGRVSNVTDFGAFVDIGVHQDGLVHISEISNDYVKEAQKVLSVGDIIKVQVLKIDPERNRISLSMKALETPLLNTQNIQDNKKKKKKKKKKKVVVQQQPQTKVEKKMPSLEDLVKHFNRLG
ncbi:S1 RNA-binding domain-containing protein [bacterium]|nr:S1 RNA-binding domain-containing protein [bacterium]